MGSSSTPMSLVNEDIPASKIFQQINDHFQQLDDAAKQKQIKSSKGVFEMHVTNGSKTGVWTIDMKEKGTVTQGKMQGVKPNVTINMSNDMFQDLAAGKSNPQKAFMTGAIKVKGNIMLATKLDTLLKMDKPQAKL